MFRENEAFESLERAGLVYLAHGSQLMAVGFDMSANNGLQLSVMPEQSIRSYLELMIISGNEAALAQCLVQLQTQPTAAAYHADKCEDMARAALLHPGPLAAALLRCLCTYPPFQQFIANVDLGGSSGIANRVRVRGYKENTQDLRDLFAAQRTPVAGSVQPASSLLLSVK